MEALRIIATPAQRRPCVCGATLYMTKNKSKKCHREIWVCTKHCGARGSSYHSALRRKVRLDLLSWGDLRRKANALIEVDKDDSLFRAL